MAALVRLQKYIADCGVCSRRSAEKLIEEGRVHVNGKPVSLGDKVDPDVDMVYLDGVRVESAGGKVYLMLYKPRGYITTMSDEHDRRCVASLVADVGVRVFPVGRLDRESEGLLLFTNDGDFANGVTHPSGRIAKTYSVSVAGVPSEEQMTSLTSSAMLDGHRTIPAVVRIVDVSKDRTLLEMTLREGRNREIRRLCEACGLEVLRLKRISEGPVKLGDLRPGKWRRLTPAEVAAVRNAIRVNSNEKKRS